MYFLGNSVINCMAICKKKGCGIMVLKMEFKKIWNLKILLIIAVMGLLFGFLFLEFPLNYFPNGPQCEQQYKLMHEWTKKYGTTMDKTEYKDALQTLKNRIGVTDAIANGSDLIGCGDEYSQQTASALDDYEFRYKVLNDNLKENLYTPAEQIRVKDIINNKKGMGFCHMKLWGIQWSIGGGALFSLFYQ